MLKIILIILIILILLVLNRIIKTSNKNWDNNLKSVEIKNTNFRTGDVVFFRHDCPIYFYGDNGINMDVHIIKNILKTFVSFNQKYYSHAGIIVVIDNTPYVYHLTAHHHFDVFSGKFIVGTPVLVKLSEIELYPGFLYHYRYIGPRIQFDIDMIEHINSQNIKLCGNIFKVVLVTILKIGKYNNNEMICTDFVKYMMNYMGIINTDDKPCDLEYIRKIVENNAKYNNVPIKLETGLSKSIR